MLPLIKDGVDRDFHPRSPTAIPSRSRAREVRHTRDRTFRNRFRRAVNHLPARTSDGVRRALPSEAAMALVAAQDSDWSASSTQTASVDGVRTWHAHCAASHAASSAVWRFRVRRGGLHRHASSSSQPPQHLPRSSIKLRTSHLTRSHKSRERNPRLSEFPPARGSPLVALLERTEGRTAGPARTRASAGRCHRPRCCCGMAHGPARRRNAGRASPYVARWDSTVLTLISESWRLLGGFALATS